MNRSIEFHDSELAAVAVDGASCVLKFRPAIIHESEGEPGVDAGRCVLQDVDLTCNLARVAGMPLSFPVAVSDGEFCNVGGTASGVVRLPVAAGGGVTLRLVTVRNEVLHVDAMKVRSSLLNDAKFLEQFEGSRNA
jgi:hypothetical protein